MSAKLKSGGDGSLAPVGMEEEVISGAGAL